MIRHRSSPMRYGKAVILVSTLAALVAGFRIYALPSLKRALPSPSDAYASDWTAIFVIEHIRTTGKWPTGWQDLRDEFERLAPESHYAWTFDELQDRVWFDFDAAINDVRAASPPRHIFALTSGRRISFNGDPNTLIRDYLRTGDDPNRVDPPIGKHGSQLSTVAPP